FWFTGSRSGMTPETMLRDVPLYGALLLPIIFLFKKRLSLMELSIAKPFIASEIETGSWKLVLAMASSLFWFFAAHVLLFKLHHPNRYTAHTLRVALSIASGVALIIAARSIASWIVRPRSAEQQDGLLLKTAAVIPTALVLIAVILFPRTLNNSPNTKYRTGHVPELYQFFLTQPKDGLIASLSPETKNIPIFARRPILVAREYSLPFHKGYYEEVSRRATDLIEASYTDDETELRRFIERYHVKFLLIEKRLLSADHLKHDAWLM